MVHFFSTIEPRRQHHCRMTCSSITRSRSDSVVDIVTTDYSSSTVVFSISPLAPLQQHHNLTAVPFPTASCGILLPPMTDAGNDQPRQQHSGGSGSSSTGGSVGVGTGPGGTDGPGTLSKEPVWRDGDNSDSGSGGGGSGDGGGKGGRWAGVPEMCTAEKWGLSVWQYFVWSKN